MTFTFHVLIYNPGKLNLPDAVKSVRAAADDDVREFWQDCHRKLFPSKLTGKDWKEMVMKAN